MIIGHRMLSCVLMCIACVLTVSGAVADSATGVLSPEEIGQQLKPRGLPKLGTVPVQSNPAMTPANVPAAPPAPEMGRPSGQPVQPVASQPAPASAPRPSVALRAITFEFGSARLKPGAMEQVRNLGIWLNGEGKDEPKLLIEGHTDKTGTRAYNDELSKRRAETVKAYLVETMGVSADRLEAVGKGFSELANAKNPHGAENRRVVVVDIGPS